MPRSVGDDEFSPGRREIAIGHVDGDALFAFRTEAVRQQGKVDRPRGSVDTALFHRGQLVFVDGFRVMEQPADECRFAVIDASSRGESKKLHFPALVEELL